MEFITNKLFQLQDLKFRDFQSQLIPSIGIDYFIGVRTPELRKYAKELIHSNNYSSFLKELPHTYFDENQLHAFLLSEINDFDTCISSINEFLPYVDNWATCDQMSPKIFKKHHSKLYSSIKRWIKSSDTYTIRFGIRMLMNHFLDDDFQEEYLDLICQIHSSEYYVNMMIAWYFATALAKQYEATITFLEEKRLNSWVHNKTIQKAIESYRITPEQKKYLKQLKLKIRG